MTGPPESQADSSPPSFDAGRIADVLTRERLAKYLTRTGGDAGRALNLYAWNQEIGAVLTVTLSQAEVCLRNQVSRALADAYGPAWHHAVKLRNAHPVAQNELAKVEDRLAKAVPTVPDIIAASDFNLWRELCKPRSLPPPRRTVTHGPSAPNSPSPANLQRLTDTFRSAMKKTIGKPRPTLKMPPPLQCAE